jgi:hypothetical protein
MKYTVEIRPVVVINVPSFVQIGLSIPELFVRA